MFTQSKGSYVENIRSLYPVVEAFNIFLENWQKNIQLYYVFENNCSISLELSALAQVLQ